ncbi:hypothetical protein QAD02_023928 [Eretmocerus hayati]|uniref:Uncharacterized protein n=1 Tax=Eretmocerus hayati TaxID=131215 RepID=A0ACC2PXA7_9HYME|nr:hypothetical protein QAD02_023928 [Eretmocerus hayati]
MKIKEPANATSDSPKSKVDKFLASKPPVESIGKKLVFSESLQEEIKRQYGTSRRTSEKQYLGALAGGKVIRKYRLLTEAKNNLVPNLQNMRKIKDSASFIKYKKKMVANTISQKRA